MLVILNIFPDHFLGLFGQNELFVKEALPVLRVVSLGNDYDEHCIYLAECSYRNRQNKNESCN